MISREKYKKVKIVITTNTKPTKNKQSIEMNKTVSCRNDHSSRFICSICLNSNARAEEKKFECDRRKSKSNPVCQQITEVYTISADKNSKNKGENKVNDANSKDVQTSRTNADRELNLLNEVLTVFKSKKSSHYTKDGNNTGNKTVIMKDACVSARFVTNIKPKLSFSKTFQLSIEEGGFQESGKFSVINSCQPKIAACSQCAIDLIKHKSSSIPQMKMEELKQSLKENSKSNKDVIEEVNRMFAIVNRKDDVDNVNRPIVRNGPRVLPVVKTDSFGKQRERKSDKDISEQKCKQCCKCCQNSYCVCMSSGDFLVKKERCENNLRHCCYNNHKNDMPTKRATCECFQKPGYDYD